MKNLLNILPAICFFLAFKLSNNDIIIATIAIILSSIFATIATKILYKEVPRMQKITIIVLLIFAIPTLLLKDASFIKYKVTVVNIILALALLFIQFGLKKNIVELFSGIKLPIPEKIFKIDTIIMALFFLVCAYINYFIAFELQNYLDLPKEEAIAKAEEIWVNYKTYGNAILNTIMIAFVCFYTFYKLTPEQSQELTQLLDDYKKAQKDKTNVEANINSNESLENAIDSNNSKDIESSQNKTEKPQNEK